MLNKLFSGRIARLRFLGSLILSLAIFIAILFGGAIMTTSLLDGKLSYGGTIALYSVVFLFVLGMFFVVFSLYVKRCHDLGLSGWYSLLMFVPIVSLLFLLYLLFAPSQVAGNQY